MREIFQGFRVEFKVLGFRVWGFRVQGSGFIVHAGLKGSGLRVQVPGFRFQVSGPRV